MNTMKMLHALPRALRACLAVVLVALSAQTHALVNGWMGSGTGAPADPRTFALTAKHDFISTSDGNSHYAWGYAHTELPMQYPGPTLIVNQGDTVAITLANTLPVPVSIVFPGQQGVSATGGNAGQLTREAPAAAAGTVVQGPTYSFVADRPGTFIYHSGTQADLQVEMGLVGAIVVRPTGFDHGNGTSHPNRKAYQHAGTQFDREHLFLLSEMDPAIHWQVYGQVEAGLAIRVDTTTIRPSIWFINGRNAPDTLLDEYVYWLPTQPYNALPRMHPGERLLMRVVNVGRDLHPFHHHGNHATPIARDAQVLSSSPADLTKAPDLTSPDFTVRSVPGQTMDLIYEWTGKGIGWDIYGTDAINPHVCTPYPAGHPYAGHHSVVTDKNYLEWCGDHNKPIPVTIPGQLDISSGESYSGSPFLGLVGTLPQGHPGLNTTGGYYHMWHSHNEREITTDDIFPGGMMTMLIVEPWTVDIDSGTGPGGGIGGGGATAVVASAQFDAGAAGSPTFDGLTLAFGAQNGNRFAVVTLTISGAPAAFGNAAVTNAPNNGNRFSKGADSCSGRGFSAGQCTITVSFNANGATARSGQLTIPYTGNSGARTLTLNLTGQ